VILVVILVLSQFWHFGKRGGLQLSVISHQLSVFLGSRSWALGSGQWVVTSYSSKHNG